MNENMILAAILISIGVGVYVFITWSNSKAARQHTQDIYQQQRLVHENPEAHRLSQAVHLVRPVARPGFDYIIKQKPDGLFYIAEWNTGGTAPAQAELDLALQKVSAVDTAGYAAMRRSEYPSVEQQLDAAYKARQGDPTEQQALDVRITEIKKKYPKSDDEL